MRQLSKAAVIARSRGDEAIQIIPHLNRWIASLR